MRLLECLLLLVLLIATCKLTVTRLKVFRMLEVSLLLPLPVAILQMLIEGPRWQMYPAYVLAFIFGASWAARNIFHKQLIRRRFAKISSAILVFFMLVIATTAPLLFPVFHFPKPTGPYKIGTVTYHWTDTSRQDIYSKDPSAKRELMAQIWYPATTSSSTHTPYVDNAHATSTGLTKDLGLPSFIFDHLQYVKTNAVASAPVATNKPSFPVLIYLTGLAGFRQSSTFQIENLVSHGYIVVGLDQPYSSAAVTLPGGQTIYSQPEDQAMPYINQSLSPSKDAPVLNEHSLPDGVIPYLAKDATFTLNTLSAMQASSAGSSLAGHFDLHHVGIFGISLGAMTSAETCHEDQRFQACLMMDAAMPADVVASGLQQPSMWITRPASDMQLENKKSGGWPDASVNQTLSTMQRTFDKSTAGNGYYVSISGMFHHNFFDIPYWSPIMPSAGLTGPIKAQRGFDIINDYTLNFFDQKLNGQTSPLLNSSAQTYPEVKFERK